MAASTKTVCAARAVSSVYFKRQGVSSHKFFKSTVSLRNLSSLGVHEKVKNVPSHLLVALSAGLIGTYTAVKSRRILANLWSDHLVGSEGCVLQAASEDKDSEVKEDTSEIRISSRREKRFNSFASCEYNGQVLMTPQDFLESLTENQPKFTRMGKIKLRDEDVKNMIKSTPSIHKGSETFFRNLHQNGIITYSEYLFLVTILTKSRTGLGIAFKMIDVDGNHHIHKDEFLGVQEMINRSATKAVKSTEDQCSDLDNTTLLVHLFGPKGQKEISFEEFFKFMDDLQSEVLELEFHEFSKSMKTISELDFARILLRNTVLTQDEYKGYLSRLQQRIPEPKGVTLEQFKSFNRFLNNIDDFIVAMRMYNMMHEPIGQDVFSRAVQVSTGENIDPYIINVVFQLFDLDGDGKLSDVEFVGIMKDRLKRGFGKFPNPHGWKGFKHCMKKEVLQS